MIERINVWDAKKNKYYKINITWVIEALEWLKKNNKFYGHITIDRESYSYLPENYDSTVFDLNEGLTFFDRPKDKDD